MDHLDDQPLEHRWTKLVDHMMDQLAHQLVDHQVDQLHKNTSPPPVDTTTN